MSESPSFCRDSSENLASAPDEAMEAIEFLGDDGHSTEDALADISKLPAYEYQPLPSNKHIRRLLLKPGSGRSRLVGALQAINIDSASSSNPFEAISYVWGSEIKDQFILVDGMPLPITSSMRESLLQIRLRGKTRAIWADSICIDQDNITEKGEQVTLMGRIYQASTCTLTCFGPGPEYQSEAIEAATLIKNVDRMVRMVYDDPKFSWGWDTFPWPAADEPLLRDEAWASWRTLLTQPWFRRGWVVQEAALGPTGVIFWAGVEIRWLSLLRVHYWLRCRVRPRMRSYNALWGALSLWGTLSLHQTAFKAACYREAKAFHPEHRRSGLEDMTILETFDCARRLELTDPRDRIYAFMAMNTRGRMPDLRPDYNHEKSHLNLYREFAVSYLELNSDLDILGFVQHDDGTDLRDARLSSWIPQWDRGTRIYSPSNWFRGFRIIKDIGTFAGSNEQTFSIMDRGLAVQVRGTIIDAVQYVSARLREPDGHPNILGQLVSLWKDVVHESARFPGPQPARPSLAFLSALARGNMEGRRDEWNASLKSLAMLLQSSLGHPESFLCPSTPPCSAETIASPLVRWSRHRRLALLGRGYYGNVPEVTRSGDACAIIYGTRTPFILRDVCVQGKEGCYQVVGAAYVASKKLDTDGVPMRLGDDGCEDWREWCLPTRTIVLC